MSEDGPVEPRIRYAGAPEITEAGGEVLAYHLYRYISPWLRETGCEYVLVSLSFDGSAGDLGAYRISASGGQAVENCWSQQDLYDAWRYANGQLVWEGGDDAAVTYEIVAVVDEDWAPSGDEASRKGQIIGYVMVRREEDLGPMLYAQLDELAAEAVRVARRNGVRLFFDEQKDRPVKSFLYGLMDRLPEWTGCDHSSSLLLTHNLDAMTLEKAHEGAFSVLVERIFFVDGDDDRDSEPDRLVGMTVEAEGDGQSVLGHALKAHREEPDELFWIYQRIGANEEGSFRPVDLGDESGGVELRNWYEIEDRPAEHTMVLIPLVHRERGERDLLGFLTLAWRRKVELAPSTPAVVREISRGLARYLRGSALYTLSVRKMWVVRKIRDCVDLATTRAPRGPEAVEAVIAQVSELVGRHVDVPSFSIGYLVGEPGERVLRYVHPHGWTHFNDLEMKVDVEEGARVDSGVSALAIRLQRPVVLAGGHGAGAEQEFKNFLWVDEKAGTLHDARSAGSSEEELRRRCTRLRDYYKPARDEAYATLAYPIRFCEILLGVLTVEVDKSTDWLWWTGFGGHLFWEMVCREVATGLYVLGDEG